MAADGTLADALRRRAAARFSGVLRVEGRPGGTVYLTDGRIRACETPGAPGLEVILVRSRKISAADLAAACNAAAPIGPATPNGPATAIGTATAGGSGLTAELVRRGLVGAGEAEALLRTALADAMFAIVSGQVDGWTEGPPADCLFSLTPAVRSGWLLAEAARRARVLASFPAAALGGDARGSARDQAFAFGRGLYEMMLHLARTQGVTGRPA